MSAGTDVGDLETVRATAADHCRSCHVVGGLATLSAAHREAAARYHGDTGAIAGQSPSQGCLNCHVREARSPWRGSSQKRQLRFYLHSSHPQGIRVIPGSGRGAARIRSTIDPALPLFDGRIECQTCHDLTVETRFLLIAFAEQDGLCLGCHRVGPERTAGGNAVAALTPAR